jgi:hypothetical protein
VQNTWPSLTGLVGLAAVQPSEARVVRWLLNSALFVRSGLGQGRPLRDAARHAYMEADQTTRTTQ